MELMVAMAIGLIILAAVSTLFVNSRQTYHSQDQLARLQENARFAMQFIMRDLRLAGYYGCLDDVNSTVVHSVLDSTSLFYSVNRAPVEGMENASGTWWPSGISDTGLSSVMRSGTDAVLVRIADPDFSTSLGTDMANPASPFAVTSAAGLSSGDIVMLADCTRADLTQITAVTGNTISHASGGATTNPPRPGNKDPADLSKAYDIRAKVMKFSTRRYYIRNNGAGNPSLYRDDNGGTAEELVEGIEMLQVLYGVDTDDPLDGVPNQYVTATDVSATNATYGWNAVFAVRIGIIARTLDNKQPDVDNRAYDADGDGVNDLPTQNDRYRRRVFQATVQLRNML